MANWDDDSNYTGSASDYVEQWDEDTALEYQSLQDFAEQAPSQGWQDLGMMHGGHEFAWYGDVKFEDDPGNVWSEVHFHVHPGAGGDGGDIFGGIWITNQYGSGQNLNLSNINLDALKSVAAQFGYDDVLPASPI